MRRRSGRVAPDRVEDRVVPDARDRAASEVRHAAIQAPGLLAHGDQAVGGHREQTRLAAAREVNDQLARARRLARVRSGAEDPPTRGSCCLPAPHGRVGGRRAARPSRARRVEAGRADLEPVSGRGSALQQLQPAADRVDRDVEPAVVVVVRDGETATDDARQSDGADRRTGIRELPGVPCAERFSSTWIGWASRARFVTGMAPLASTRSGSPSRSRSAHDVPQPVNDWPKAAAKPGRPSANVEPFFTGGRPVEHRVLLAARVADEKIGQPVAVDVRSSRRPCRHSGRRRRRSRHAPRSGSRGRQDQS